MARCTDGPGTIEYEVGVARCGAIRDHRYRFGCSVGGVHIDLNVEHRGQTTQTLCAYTRGIDLVAEFDT